MLKNEAAPFPEFIILFRRFFLIHFRPLLVIHLIDDAKVLLLKYETECRFSATEAALL